MDDSEKSYGYSKDIYHGRKGPGGEYDQTGGSSHEGSYELEGEDGGPGWEGLDEKDPVSPEEAALHVEESPGGLTAQPVVEDYIEAEAAAADGDEDEEPSV